jgi:hypothetical protein
MKRATVNPGRTLKPIVIAVALFTITAVTYGQMRLQKPELLKNIKERIAAKAQNEDIFKTVVYYETCENTMAPHISRTIHVSKLEVKYDERLEVEEWMTTSFENNLEEAVVIEDWMTSTFDIPIEEGLTVEEWMTTSFETELEPSVSVESWMTAPFEMSQEQSIEVENWMTAPFETAELEASLQLEPWMSEPQTWLN